MGKFKAIWLPILAVLAVIGFFAPSTDSGTPDPTPTVTSQPTKTPLPTPTKTSKPSKAPKPQVVSFWTDGLSVDDVTDQTSRSCSFDMCIFLKLKANKTCSSITVDGTTYTADDEEVDSFSQDFKKLLKGKTRTVEFGTDAMDDSEDYVDYDDVTCWK